MRTQYRKFTALVIGCLLAVATPVAGQSPEKSGRILVPISDVGTNRDERSAQALYEEANGYIGQKFAEFNEKKIAYDSKLDAKTKQEQKELALYNATTLAARNPLAGDDLYYLGMLHHLSGESDAALEAMRRFLANTESGGSRNGERPQIARAVFVLHATKKNLMAEAESAVAAYRKAEPLDFNELYGMEALLTDAFSKAKDYGRMAAHARGMLEVARQKTESKKLNSFKRDERLFRGSSLLAEALEKMNQKDAAVAVIEDLVKLSIALPSGNLYKMARIRLAGLNPTADPLKWLGGTAEKQTTSPPEIVAAQWIDQQPTKLADLRGQVVLLDFWAHWCGPCHYVFPKLQRWHESYKDKGLVILGVTNYFGQANGVRATAAEELDYLRDFKKKNRLPYGFVVADSSVNDLNYGISSIPMSFLIDRSGKVRFIAVGANDQEIAALGKMIKELIDEPVTQPTQSSQRQRSITVRER